MTTHSSESNRDATSVLPERYHDRKILEMINTIYGIDAQDVQNIQEGNANCWKILTSQEPIFFKKFRGDIVQDESRIKEIIDVQQLFARNGVPVLLPLQTLEGKSYSSEQGGFYIAYPYARGEQKKKEKLDQTNIESAAHNLARMHLVGRNSHINLSYVFKGWKSKEEFQGKATKLEQFIKSKSKLEDVDEYALQQIDLKRQVINSLNNVYANLGLESDHITHGDYHEKICFLI